MNFETCHESWKVQFIIESYQNQFFVLHQNGGPRTMINGILTQSERSEGIEVEKWRFENFKPPKKLKVVSFSQ